MGYTRAVRILAAVLAVAELGAPGFAVEPPAAKAVIQPEALWRVPACRPEPPKFESGCPALLPMESGG